MAKTSKKKKGTAKKKRKRKAKTVTVKKTKKTTRKKRGSTKIKYESVKEIRLDRVLTDNFVALQKVMVNLSKKFDDLSGEISKLLNLFEISAQTLAKKDLESGGDSKDTKKILEKLDTISKHAGLIGKGLALIHEQGKEGREEYEESFPEMQRYSPPQVQRPMMLPPQRPMKRLPPRQGFSEQEDHMHIESNEEKTNERKNSF